MLNREYPGADESSIVLKGKVPLLLLCTAVWCCKMQCSATQCRARAVPVQWMNWQGRLGQAGTSKAVTAGRKKGSRPIPGKQVSTQSLVTNILFSKHSSPRSPLPPVTNV